MEQHIFMVQMMQLVFLAVIIPAMAFVVFRTWVKIRVNWAVYRMDIRKYMEDKVLEKQTSLNKKRE